MLSVLRRRVIAVRIILQASSNTSFFFFFFLKGTGKCDYAYRRLFRVRLCEALAAIAPGGATPRILTKTPLAIRRLPQRVAITLTLPPRADVQRPALQGR